MKKLPVLMIVILLLHSVTVETTDERRFNILKFGKTEDDYVMFQHDMSQFETGFTVCSWVRKLRNDQVPTWFSYAVSDQAYEIQISDMGDRTRIFGDLTNLASLYTVTPGTWFHNCLSWDSATSTRDVYIDGVRVDSKATPAGRTLLQGGTIVLGNEQQSRPGAGMDDVNMFWGELYKLNMFTRKLSGSEIREMSEDRCSEVEMIYEEERGLKWIEVLQKTRYGSVAEIESGCRNSAEESPWLSKIQQLKRTLNETLVELEQTKYNLENKEEQLNSTSLELGETKSDLENKEQQLNSTTLELKQTKSDLENKEEQLNSTYLELEQTKSDLENKEEQLNFTTLELEQTKYDLENKEEQLNSTTLELEHTKSDLENKDKQLNSTYLELEQTKYDLENKQEQLNSTTLELEQTKSDLENKDEQLNSTTLELEQTKSDLENNVDQLNSTTLELEQTKSDLENKARELNTTSQTLDLTQTELVKIRAELEKSANFTPLCSPNTTVTSHWDLLYSERFFGGVVTEEKLGVLRSSIQKLEYFVGVKVTDGIINFFKIFHDGEEEQCP